VVFYKTIRVEPREFYALVPFSFEKGLRAFLVYEIEKGVLI